MNKFSFFSFFFHFFFFKKIHNMGSVNSFGLTDPILLIDNSIWVINM